MYIIYILGYLLPWRIIAGSDRGRYLHLPHPIDPEGSRPGNNKCNEKWNKSSESKTIDPTKKLLHKKKEPDKTGAETGNPDDMEGTS